MPLKSTIIFTCLLLTLFLGITQAFAQLKIYLVQKKSKSSNHLRTKETTPLSLPFWDDFSTAPDNTLNTLLWEEGSAVWINNTMAVKQPTVNVATFDGLDENGIAYSRDLLVTGYSDTLTSQPINLEDPSINRTNVYLSFFYQWQGNGEAPDLSDYLELQFKDSTNVWRSMLSIYPKSTFERNVFYDTMIRVDNGYFFHKDFQFRFMNYGRQSGPFDTWNLDYVYLNDERIFGDKSFPERAIASNVSSPFGLYNAIPYWHFNAQQFADTVVNFDVKNLSNSLDPNTGQRYFISVNYAMVGTFKNYFETTSTIVTDTLVPSSTGVNSNGIMEPYEHLTVSTSNLFQNSEAKGYFDPQADSVDVTIKSFVISGDKTDRDKDKLTPIDLTINDTVTNTYNLRSYYAYDDGVAEYSAGLIEAGSVIAYRFEKLYPAADTLIAFDIYFPPFALTSNQTLNFFIYSDNNGKPGDVLLQVFRGVKTLGINQFQRIEFQPAILITQPSFYIGWQQPLSGKATVGLDLDNDTGDRIFYSTDRINWNKNENVQGSLMLRPVFGVGSIESIVPGVEEGEELPVEIYPNPTQGEFYIEGAFDNLEIVNTLGGKISFEQHEVNQKTKIKLTEAPGIYLVRITKGSRQKISKILLYR